MDSSNSDHSEPLYNHNEQSDNRNEFENEEYHNGENYNYDYGQPVDNMFEIKVRTQTVSSFLPLRRKRSVTFAGADQKYKMR